MARDCCGAGEPGPAERDRIAARRLEQRSVRSGIPNRVFVVRGFAARAVRVPELVAPGVLSAIGLEAVDADLVNEVAPLLEPPARAVRVRPVRHERSREPPAAVAIRAAIRFADSVA